MDIQKYSVNQHLIETLLAWVKSGEIAIPESVFTMNIENYDEFLLQRRKLMVEKMRQYYYSL